MNHLFENVEVRDDGVDAIECHVKHFLRWSIEINLTKFEHQNIIAVLYDWNVVAKI